MADVAAQAAGHAPLDVETELACILSQIAWMGQALEERGQESGAGEILQSIARRIDSVLSTMGGSHG